MHEAPGLVPMVMTRLEGRFGELSATGLSGLVWGAAVLGHLTVPAFEAANQLLDAKNLQEFTARVRVIASSTGHPPVQLRVHQETSPLNILRHCAPIAWDCCCLSDK